MKDFVRELLAGQMDRRQASRKLAALGLGLVTLPYLAKPAAAEDAKVVYYTWEGYEIPELHPAFAAKYGPGALETPLFATVDEALLKVQAGFQVTVAHPCTDGIGRWYEAGMIQPLDTSRLSHYPDLFEQFKTIEGTVFDGKPYYAPFDWGNSSVLYRTDIVKSEESWMMLFDESLAGRISMYGDAQTAVEVAGLAAGYKNIFTMDDTQLATVRELLIKQKKLSRFYWDSQSAMEQAMASGEIVATYAWNASLVNLKKQGLPVAYANPKEGILTWVCGLVMMKNPIGSVDAAYDFIDAMLDPAAGKYLIDVYNYGHSNKKSFEIADPASLEALGMTKPAELFSSGVYAQQVPEPFNARYQELFNEVQAL